MPPPPPPSKSYLLVLDSDSDSDSDDSSTAASSSVLGGVPPDEQGRGGGGGGDLDHRDDGNRRLHSHSPTSSSGATATSGPAASGRTVGERDNSCDERESDEEGSTRSTAASSSSPSSPPSNGKKPKNDNKKNNNNNNNKKRNKGKKRKNNRKNRKNSQQQQRRTADEEEELEVGGVTNANATANTATEAATAPPSPSSSPQPQQQAGGGDDGDRQRRRHYRRSVSFGSVHVREYARCLGRDAVPADGGWPLGLSWRVQSCSLLPPADDDNDNDENDVNTRDDDDDDSSDSDSSCCSDGKKSTVSSGSRRSGGSTSTANSIRTEPRSVDEYEENKQRRLRARLEQVQKLEGEAVAGSDGIDNCNSSTSSIPEVSPAKSHGTPGKDGDGKDGSDSASQDYLETRAWDYRQNGKKNPLFGTLLEQERMELLLEHSAPVPGEDDEAEDGRCSSPLSFSTPSPPASPGGATGRRIRSNSFGTHQQMLQQQKQQQRRGRSRSNSFGTSSGGGSKDRGSLRQSASMSSFPERFNNAYTQIDVHHVRNELEQLRNSRSVRGCDCRKLVVYIPPKDGAECGKRAQKRRMNILKVKEELRKRKLLPRNDKSIAREELERMLRDAVEGEPCCMGDCPCVQHGIGCQENACSCWTPSHQTKATQLKTGGNISSSSGAESGGSDDFSAKTIRTRCGNKYGMYAVDFRRIDSYRRQWICPEIVPSTSPSTFTTSAKA